MKQSFRLFHLPVFIVILIGLALSLVLHFTQPRASLLDYALTLQEGQFVSETGLIYELAVDYPSGLTYVERVGEVSKPKFRVSFGSTPAEKLLPHEFAMQMTDYGSIYIGSDGSVWQDTHEEYGDDDALLIRYLTPAAVPDSSNTAELKITEGRLRQVYVTDELGRQTPSETFFDKYYKLAFTFSADPYIGPADIEFSVRLKDGWYAICSRTNSLKYIYLPNVGFDTAAKAQCRLTAYDLNTDSTLACGEFDMNIKNNRIHISDNAPKTYDLN